MVQFNDKKHSRIKKKWSLIEIRDDLQCYKTASYIQIDKFHLLL